jgi:hypothetical protein
MKWINQNKKICRSYPKEERSGAELWLKCQQRIALQNNICAQSLQSPARDAYVEWLAIGLSSICH